MFIVINFVDFFPRFETFDWETFLLAPTKLFGNVISDPEIRIEFSKFSKSRENGNHNITNLFLQKFIIMQPSSSVNPCSTTQNVHYEIDDPMTLREGMGDYDEALDFSFGNNNMLRLANFQNQNNEI